MRFRKRRQSEGLRPVQAYLLAGLLCMFGLSLVYSLDVMHMSGALVRAQQITDAAHRFPRDIYVPLHSVLEFISIVVSFAVFIVGWYGYAQTKNRQDLFVAAAYIAVGSIDFVHTLSFRGMPNFLGENTVGKAAAYWLAARLLDGAALLCAAFIAKNTGRSWIRRGIVTPVAGILVVGLVTLISVNAGAVSNLMYSVQNGVGSLTPLKVSLEYLVITLYAAAFWAFGRSKAWNPESVRLMRTALIIAIASEVCFTLYTSAYDSFNLLGHVYKATSYYFVLQALFVSSLKRPYMELAETKDQLRRSFTRIGDALASGLRKEPTLKLIASLAREMLGADFAAIGEITERDTIHVTTFDGIYPEPFEVPVKKSISGRMIASRHPVIVPDLMADPLARPNMLEMGLRSFLAAPVLRGTGAIGTIYVASLEPGKFLAEDADMLVAFARQASIALQDSEHYEKEHRIADELQQVIFPPPRLEYDGYLVTGKYQPAWDEARVGGDFYDYFDLPDGRLAVLIGDVSGKGLHAAVHTAIVKYSCQAYLRDGFEPGEALKRVDRAFIERTAMASESESKFVSLFCGVIDAASGRLVYANAGHEPAAKVSVDGIVEALDSTGPILGLGLGSMIEQDVTFLKPGDSLLLYTDGITEARDGTDLFGFARLAEALKECARRPAEESVELVYNRAQNHSENGRFKDDVAMVMVRRSATAAISDRGLRIAD